MLILSGLQGGEGREGEESRACNEGYRKVYLVAFSAIVESLRKNLWITFVTSYFKESYSVTSR